jgi:hypothetical protein
MKSTGFNSLARRNAAANAHYSALLISAFEVSLIFYVALKVGDEQVEPETGFFVQPGGF